MYALMIAASGVLVFSFLSEQLKNRPAFDYRFGEDTLNGAVEYSDARFAVLSDLHYYDSTLGTDGSAFEACLNSDLKLLKESSALLDLTVERLLVSKVDFVLVSGDLTKDGELICHQRVADALSLLKEKGIRVFVIPGNHDVNNPGAFRYEENQTLTVPSVSHSEFAAIYDGFGYGDALYKDENSLSYVSAISETLWLLAIDTCRSEENKPGKKEIVGGKLDVKQEKWIEEMLDKANQERKAVIVMAHHGINEHWKGQKDFAASFLVDNYQYIGKLLASYNVRVAFTGHYHAQDITLENFGEYGFLYDIETGSLITPPCEIRYCTIEDNKMTVQSESLLEQLYSETDFISEANRFVFDSVTREARNVLKKFLVSQKDAEYIADYAAHAFIVHYQGDEDVSLKPLFDIKKLSLWGRLVYSQLDYVIEGLWDDLKPMDNEVVLNLEQCE